MALLAWAEAQGMQAVRGDFNGDGVPDRARLARYGQETPAGVAVANPWGLAPAAPRAGVWGILVEFGGEKAPAVFLSDADFFASPMWKTASADMLRAKKQGKRSVLSIATESGAEEVVVWTGKGWKLVPGEDMP